MWASSTIWDWLGSLMLESLVLAQTFMSFLFFAPAKDGPATRFQFLNCYTTAYICSWYGLSFHKVVNTYDYKRDSENVYAIMDMYYLKFHSRVNISERKCGIHFRKHFSDAILPLENQFGPRYDTFYQLS